MKVSCKKNSVMPMVAIAIAVLVVACGGDAYAMDWPPTASDITSALTTVATAIGALVAAAVVVGLGLYGGWQGLMAAISSFGKLLGKAFSSR